MSLSESFSTISSAIQQTADRPGEPSTRELSGRAASTQFGREVLMNKTAPARPPTQRSLCVLLPATPTAATQARCQVRAAMESWGVSADPYVAALLTSELVTNAIRYAAETIKLFVTCSCGHLRVYVHDMSRELPVALDPSVEAEDGRGLMLVASLATAWGSYRTSAGKAVYFTLALEVDPDER